MTRKVLPAAALAALLLTAPAAPGQETRAVEGEIVVRFASPVTAAQRAEVRRDEGVRAVESMIIQGAQVVRVRDGVSVDEAVEDLEARPEVLWATPNFVDHIVATPNDPRFGQQWGLHNTGQAVNGVSGTADADIDAPEAWDLETGGSEVVVAINDSGVDATHPDLASQMWTNPGESGGGKETNGIDDDGNTLVDDFRGWDFVDEDNDPRDENGHGTAVAGTAVARGNETFGMTGVSQAATILPTRVANRLGEVPFADYIQGLEYAAEHADVVNQSTGGLRAVHAQENTIFSGASDVLFVAAAGNNGATISVGNPFAPCGAAHLAPVQPNVLCVGATDENDASATFSNVGATLVDLHAPGVRITTPRAFEPLFTDSFNDPLAGRWSTGGTNNTWDRSTTTFFTSPASLVDSPGANYLDNTNSFVQQVNTVDLSGRSVCRVVYSLDTDFADLGDVIALQVDPGNVQLISHNADPTPSARVTAPFGVTGNPQLRVRFRFTTNGAGVDSGLVIDDVAVECLTLTHTANSFALFNGTSFAAPMTTGAAALLLAKEPEATVAGIRKALIDGTDVKAGLAGLSLTGARLNARGALDDLDTILPDVITQPPTGVTSTGATLVGDATLGFGTANVRFEYGTTTGYGSSTTPEAAVGGNVTEPIAGLAPSTTYHYRAVIESAMGTRRGADQQFSTLAPTPTPPTATTNAASAITPGGATLNGNVVPGSAPASAHFEYGTTATYGSSTPSVGASGGPVSAPITGLAPNTEYHYRVVATSIAGDDQGDDMTFTTGNLPPVAVTNPADGVTATSATLRGSVTPGTQPTTYRFEYGTTTAYGQSTADTAAAGGAVSATVTGLAPDTQYHYRVVATSTAGDDDGADQTFTTATLPANGGNGGNGGGAGGGGGGVAQSGSGTPSGASGGAGATGLVGTLTAAPSATIARTSLRGVSAPASARFARGALTAALTNTDSVAVTGTITADTAGARARAAARLGATSFRLPPNGRATVRVRVSRKAARSLRRARRIRLTVVTRAPGRSAVTKRATVRLRR